MLLEFRDKLPLLRNWLKFKSVFKNGIIYSYNGKWDYRQKELGISRNTFHNNISAFIELGWAHKQGDAIYLTGKREINKKLNDKNGYAYLDIDPSTDILEQLRFLLVDRKIKQMLYAKARKQASEYTVSPKKRKRLISGILKKSEEAFQTCSLSAMAKMLGCSKSHAHNILKKLRKAGLVQIRRRKNKFIGYFTMAEFYALGWKKMGCFWKHGKVFKRYKCSYRIKPEKNLQKMLTKLFKDFRWLKGAYEMEVEVMKIKTNTVINTLPLN